MTVDTWLAKRLDYLRELKAPSATQKLLLALASKPALSAREQRELDALVRLEKINDRAAQAKVKAHKILREKDDDDRKARNHRLIMQGALIDLAGLQNVDKGVLLGALARRRGRPWWSRRHEDRGALQGERGRITGSTRGKASSLAGLASSLGTGRRREQRKLRPVLGVLDPLQRLGALEARACRILLRGSLALGDCPHLVTQLPQRLNFHRVLRLNLERHTE